MVYEKDTVILTGNTFETVLDTACNRLRETRVQYFVRRIGELDNTLAGLERELDKIIGRKFGGSGTR